MPNYHDNYRWLVEWVWPSTTYRYASFEDVTHDGHTWQRRILGIDGLQGQYIDADEADFGDVQVRLCDLADDGSTSFPFLALNEVDDFEDKEVHVYLYDATTDTKQLIWSGITTRPEFDPNEYTCTIRATFPLDAIELQFPSVPLAHRCVNRFGGSDYETASGAVPSVACPYATYGTPGFTTCDKSFDNCTERGMTAFFMGWTHVAPVQKGDVNNLVERDDVRSSVVPIVIGSGEFKIRPEIYRAVILEDRELVANFVLSGVHSGLPFDSAQLDASKFKLGSETRATSVDFKTGIVNQPVPGNRTIFPDASGHSFVAYGAARFPLDEDQVAKYSDGVAYHAITVKLDGGRKTLRSGAITENPVYALEDCLRDPIFGPGLPVAKIDSAAVIAAASFVGGRFRGRFEIDRPEPLLDYMQRCFATWHGYATFNDGLLQLGAKRDDETAAAIFGTGGYKILDHDAVVCKEKDFRDIVNDRIARYRTKMRNKRNIPYEDKGAQIKAGNGLVKVISEEIFLEGIYDDDEAAISAAIGLREIVNLNLWIEFRTPLHDWLASGVKPGKVIRVNSPHIWNNDSNYLFRVLVPTIDTTTFEVTVRARIYKSVVYAYNADPIGGDLLRDDGDTSIATRPPDVENVAVAVGSVETDDDDDKNVHLICTWDYPDLTAQMAEDALEGIFPKYPIEAVKLHWRYTDESINDLKLGARVRHPTTKADLLVPFHRNRQVEVWFVAVGRSNGQGALGYVLDSSQTTHLDEDLDATEIAIDVDDASFITAGEYVKCESELLKVLSVAGDTVTVENVAGVRTPQFDTTASGHAEGTEFGVAVKSHPTDTADLTARRFTLPQVAGVVSRSRPRGVRVKWTNLTDYDAEKYFLYWSIDGSLDDADAWVASWTSQNPKSPTSGINLVKCGKKAHHLIPQEDIDAAYGGDASGVAVQVRVTAKIKNNYSTALSALPGDSPGHHNRPWAPPADPIAGDITQEVVATSDRVKVTTRVYATSDRTTGTPRTWDQVNSHIAGLVFEKYNKAGAAWSGVFIPVSEEIEDPDSSFQDIERTFHKGSRWRIRRAFARNPGSKRAVSSLVLLEFQVGSQSDVLSGITDLAIAAFGSDENTDSIELDGNDSQLLVTWTQPGTPVTLRELQIRKKKTTATKWRRVPAVQLLDRVDDNGNPFNDAVVPAKAVRVDVHHPRGVTMDFEVRLVGADGDTTSWASINRSTTDDAGGGDLPIRSDGDGPSYPTSGHIVRNHVIGANAGTSVVDFGYTPYMDGTTGDNTFDTPDATFGPVRSITAVLQPRNGANTLDVGEPVRITVHAEKGKGSLGAPFVLTGKLEIGQRYRMTKLIYNNGADELIRTGSVDFVGGALSFSFDATAISGGTITADTATSGDNRASNTTTSFTQPSTPVLLQSATYEVSNDNGSTWKHRKTRHLLGKAPKISVASAAVVLQEAIQHRKNISQLKFRVILTPFGSTYETGDTIASPNKVLTSGAETSADDGYAADNNNPASAAAAPTILKATIGPAGLTCRCSKPSDARPYLQRYEYQFANATSGAGTDWLDPDLGTIALLNTNPTAGDVALAAATFASDHRFTASDTQKRDLDVAFKSGTAQGVLALFVRARIVDLDDAGTVRNGTWSGFTAVTHRRAVDQDTDVRNVGTGNLVDGGNCDTDSSQYSPAAGTTATIGRHMSLSPSGAGTRITTSTSKIFWDKTRRCVSINNTNNSNQLCIRLYGVLTPEQIYWLTFAIRGQASAFNPGAIVAALYDAGGAGTTKASVSINRTLSNGTYDLIGVKFDLSGVSAWTGNPWLIFDPPNTWASGIIDITRIKLAPGPTPTLFERGAQEVGLDASSGVGLGDIGGLAALERNVSLNVEGITTWGVLATT